MGLFQNKKDSPADQAQHEVENFFDEAFREELRGRARMYFDKIVNENATLFKQDLDSTIMQVYSELKTQLSKKFDEQFSQYGAQMQEAQNLTLKSLNRSVQGLQEQHQRMSAELQKNIAEQEKVTLTAFEENRARMVAVQEAQDLALQSLNSSVEALQQQHQQLAQSLKENAAKQEASMIEMFEQNMAQVVEHYLLGALGDQYDIKAQLPSIIKQMEAQKEAIVEDLKL